LSAGEKSIITGTFAVSNSVKGHTGIIRLTQIGMNHSTGDELITRVFNLIIL
jgi:hypothetical protein